MTDLGASRWRNYHTINWQRLAKAHAFFSHKGYQYVEVPWAVSENITRATLPPGATPIAVRGADAILVGSAEQGFLDIATRGIASRIMSTDTLYFSISPCFRGESAIAHGHTQLSFMKLELFVLTERSEMTQVLLENAEQFMTAEGARLARVDTNEGVDLECEGIEVGSYGARRYQGVTWSYGTGLAEPRFSYALQVQEEDE